MAADSYPAAAADFWFGAGDRSGEECGEKPAKFCNERMPGAVFHRRRFLRQTPRDRKSVTFCVQAYTIWNAGLRWENANVSCLTVGLLFGSMAWFPNYVLITHPRTSIHNPGGGQSTQRQGYLPRTLSASKRFRADTRARCRALTCLCFRARVWLLRRVWCACVGGGGFKCLPRTSGKPRSGRQGPDFVSRSVAPPRPFHLHL